MYKYILVVFVLFYISPSLKAEESFYHESYSYVKGGTGFIDLLNVGVGHRKFAGGIGFDVALEAGSCVLYNDVGLKFHPLFRTDPYASSSFYFGPGFGVGVAYLADWTRDYVGVVFQGDLMAGYSWQNEYGKTRFVQFQAGVGSVEYPILPLCRLEFGLGF